MKSKPQLVKPKATTALSQDNSRNIVLEVQGFGEIHPALRRVRHYKSLDNALKGVMLLAHLYLAPGQTLELSHAVTGKQLAWHQVKVGGYHTGWTILDEEYK